MGGAEPLLPPTAEVASAFLDAAGLVERRREERIDRRMLGWLHLIDGAVVGALLSAVLVSMQWGPPGRQIPLLIIVALVIWMECAGELRDRTGFQQSWLRSWSVPYLIVFVPTMALGLMPPGDLPSDLLVLVPLVVSLVAFGSLATKQWRSARPDESVVRAESERFTGRAAISTTVVGALIGAMIAAVGLGDPASGSVVALVLMCVLLGITIAKRAWASVPGLAQGWRRPQWIALSVAAVVFLALIGLGAWTSLVTIQVSLSAGAAVFAMFLVVSGIGVVMRDVSSNRRNAEHR